MVNDNEWWEEEGDGGPFRLFAGDLAREASLWMAVRQGTVQISLERGLYPVVLVACEGYDAERGYNVFRSAGGTLVDVWPAEELVVTPLQAKPRRKRTDGWLGGPAAEKGI
ncbi:MAG: hypothetical protein BroJett033_8140 [Chloroflexota bacterium]|nr:MAG: hypothetical protein BroJett033_8140 [Chloroflexota bacterium]